MRGMKVVTVTWNSGTVLVSQKYQQQQSHLIDRCRLFSWMGIIFFPASLFLFLILYFVAFSKYIAFLSFALNLQLQVLSLLVSGIEVHDFVVLGY